MSDRNKNCLYSEKKKPPLRLTMERFSLKTPASNAARNSKWACCVRSLPPPQARCCFRMLLAGVNNVGFYYFSSNPDKIIRNPDI